MSGDPAQVIIDRIAFLLRQNGGAVLGRKKRTVVQTIPLLNDLEFEGHKLRVLMSPYVTGSGLETEDIFDSWLWPVHRPGEGDSVTDLREKTSDELVSFVTHVKDFGVQTVRLLYALSGAEGAKLEITPESVMVHHGEKSYGIIEGRVYSRFCDGLKIDVDHMKVLTECPTQELFNAVFCRLYREALRIGGGVERALVALHIGRPTFNFRRISRAKVFVHPTDYLLNSWSIDMARCKDPVGAMYRKLVPRYMTKMRYRTIFGNIPTRNLEPDDAKRQMYINKVYAYFHELKAKNTGYSVVED